MEILAFIVLCALLIHYIQRQPTQAQLKYWQDVNDQGERYVAFLKRMGVTHEEVLRAPVQIRNKIHQESETQAEIVAVYFPAKEKYQRPSRSEGDIGGPLLRAMRQSHRRREDF